MFTESEKIPGCGATLPGWEDSRKVKIQRRDYFSSADEILQFLLFHHKPYTPEGFLEPRPVKEENIASKKLNPDTLYSYKLSSLYYSRNHLQISTTCTPL